MPGDEVGELIRDLKGVPRDVQRRLRPAIIGAGRDVLERARLNASWSSRIPGATRLSVRFSRNPGVDVITDGRKAPHASVYENDGKPGVKAHPLFGNRRHRYRFAARPFLGPAMDAEAPDAAARIGDVVDRALFDHRFR
jgi:hypothetical protein